ncbi:MAG: hypothetical protein NVSMB25_05280 [Thermoleophilaceae bacterium]
MSRGRLAGAVAALVVAVLAQAPNAFAATVIGRPSPASAAGPPRLAARRDARGDPLAELGGDSPFCSRSVGGLAARNCRVSGSISHAYPLASYGIDNQVDVGITKIHNNLLAALQDVGTFVWMVLVFVVKGVLLLLEWAFSIDLVNRAMAAVVHSLDTLHRSVIGQPWFLAALSVAGLSGIWRGLVQRQSTQTIGGLAATVALMVVALILISNPQATVGHASRLADQAALGVVSATSTGTVEAPDTTFAIAMRKLFDTTVLRPWAALEFGDPTWALAPAKPGSTVTNADVWLAFPAASPQRRSLFKLQKGDSDAGLSLPARLADAIATGGALSQAIGLIRGVTTGEPALARGVRAYVHPDPSRVRMQEASGTFSRLALLALIAIGLTGAVLLFAYVGIKLLLASIMSLLLVLLAPAMLLAPAFGESGRATTVAWLRRLAAAITAKLVYSLLLAILLIASSAIESLALGWFATWLILIAFWWGVLLKRGELLGFVSAGQGARPGRQGGGGGGATRALYGARLAGRLLGGRGGPGGAGFPLPQLSSGVQEGEASEERIRGEWDALGEESQAELAALAKRRDTVDVEDSRAQLDRRTVLEDELYSLDGELARYDARVAAASRRADTGRGKARILASERPLLERRERLRDEIASPAFRRAEAVLAESDASRGDATADASWRARRRVEVESLAADHPRHLRAAGIDPAAYRAADDESRAAFERRVRAGIERDRRELGLAPGPAEPKAVGEQGTVDVEARIARALPEDADGADR